MQAEYRNSQKKGLVRGLLLRRMWFILPGILALVATLFAQHNPVWTEQVYSQTVYPVLSTVVGYVPSLVRVSFTEWLMLAFILFCVGYIFYYLRKIIKGEELPCTEFRDDPEAIESTATHKRSDEDNSALKNGAADSETLTDSIKSSPEARSRNRGMIFYRGVMGAVAIVCMVYFAFTILCGLNYHRLTFTYYTGYTIEQSSVEELEQLCRTLADELNSTRVDLGVTDRSVAAPGEFDYYAQQSVVAMQALAEEYPVLKRDLYSTPKAVVASGLLSDAGIGGVFFPFTLESNINDEVPFFSTPSNMTHELAHQCGFMREDEANYIAYLACKQSDDPLMRYSGYLMAFNYSLTALRSVNPDLASEIASNLSEAVQADRAQSQRFWAEHQGKVNEISRDINDAYLRSNNQRDGVKSYNRMVELLLAEQREAKR